MSFIMRENSELLAVTVGSLAKDLNLSKGAVYQAIKRGEIDVIEIGRSKRIPQRERRRILKLDAS